MFFIGGSTTECETVDEVFEVFNQSIYKNEEGVIIKKIDSKLFH